MTLGDTKSEIFSCQYDPTDKYLACGYGDGAVRVYNTDNGKCSFTLFNTNEQKGEDAPDGCNVPVCALRWRPQSAQMKTGNVLVSAQADGYLKHWHATSGRCLHQKKVQDEETGENQLYSIDYNPEGSLLACAGKDRYVRLYDEQTKTIALKMKENSDFCGHSNRVFCVKFNPTQPNCIASGGWDNTIQIYDLRAKGVVGSIYGPHVCGDAIDFKNDGFTMMTGSYRMENALELWDLRNGMKYRDINWNGPGAQLGQDNMNMEDAGKPDSRFDSRPSTAQSNFSTSGASNKGGKERAYYPMIYAAQFS